MPELLPLRIGHCRGPEALTRRGGRWRIATFPAGAGLIRHWQGDVLFDSGYGAAFWRATRSLPERLYRWTTPATLRVDERLPEQLGRLNARPALVVLSHLHADHVSGLFDIPEVPVLTSRAAFDALAQGGRIATLKSGMPDPLRRRLRALNPRFVEDCPQVAPPPGFAGFGPIHDVLNDGQMLAVPLPGHGAGQFGLFLPETPKGPQFLIADAAWSRAALRDDAPPPDATLKRLGDRAAYLQTFARLRRLMAERPEITLWPSHCAEAFPAARQDMAPASTPQFPDSHAPGNGPRGDMQRQTDWRPVASSAPVLCQYAVPGTRTSGDGFDQSPPNGVVLDDAATGGAPLRGAPAWPHLDQSRAVTGSAPPDVPATSALKVMP